MSTRYQIQAFKRQFPAIFSGDKPLIDERCVRDVRVARVTRELLETTPTSWEVAHRDGDHEDDDTWLLNADLSPIGKVISERTYGSERLGLRRDGETIGEAIARMGCTDRVAAILRRRAGYEVRSGEQVDRYEAVLYLAPKGWTIRAWIAEQQRLADARLSSAVASICDASVA